MNRFLQYFTGAIVGMSLFIIFQNCAKSPYSQSTNSSVSSLDMKRYYLMVSNYSCVNASNQKIATYKDSFYIYNGEMCETGDLCTNKTDCKPWPQDLVIAPDLQSAQYNGQTYSYFANSPY